jgi:hypothetical protein
LPLCCSLNLCAPSLLAPLLSSFSSLTLHLPPVLLLTPEAHVLLLTPEAHAAPSQSWKEDRGKPLPPPHAHPSRPSRILTNRPGDTATIIYVSLIIVQSRAQTTTIFLATFAFCLTRCSLLSLSSSGCSGPLLYHLIPHMYNQSLFMFFTPSALLFSIWSRSTVARQRRGKCLPTACDACLRKHAKLNWEQFLTEDTPRTRAVAVR